MKSVTNEIALLVGALADLMTAEGPKARTKARQKLDIMIAELTVKKPAGRPKGVCNVLLTYWSTDDGPEHLTFEEIGKRLGVKAQTVRNMVNRNTNYVTIRRVPGYADVVEAIAHPRFGPNDQKARLLRLAAERLGHECRFRAKNEF